MSKAWWLSLLWSLLNQLGYFLSRWRVVKLSVPVVSVGNIQAGGSGKTPVVIWAAQQAAQNGLQVLILTRGYGGKLKSSETVVIPPGRLAVDPVRLGDESALMHLLCPEAWIAVGRDRVRGFFLAEEVAAKTGVSFDLVLLEDGFQYWRLHRDYEWVTWTSLPWGKGVFRDFFSTLKRADWVLWTKGDRAPHLPSSRWVRCRYVFLPLLAEALEKKSRGYWLVAGVAFPEQVASQLRAQGYPLRRLFAFPDHAQYHLSQIQALLDQAKKENIQILLTGKDAVKWQALLGAAWEESALQVIEPQLGWEEGSEAFLHSWMTFLKERVQKRKKKEN